MYKGLNFTLTKWSTSAWASLGAEMYNLIAQLSDCSDSGSTNWFTLAIAVLQSSEKGHSTLSIPSHNYSELICQIN